jgi:hypothetical protein
MEDTLPPGLVYIHADVVAIRTEFVIDSHAFLRQELHTGARLFRGEIEKICTMPKRYDQGMARTDRVAVALTIGQLIAPRHRTRRTKPTRVVRVAHELFDPEIFMRTKRAWRYLTTGFRCH